MIIILAMVMVSRVSKLVKWCTLNLCLINVHLIVCQLCLNKVVNNNNDSSSSNNNNEKNPGL